MADIPKEQSRKPVEESREAASHRGVQEAYPAPPVDRDRQRDGSGREKSDSIARALDDTKSLETLTTDQRQHYELMQGQILQLIPSLGQAKLRQMSESEVRVAMHLDGGANDKQRSLLKQMLLQDPGNAKIALLEELSTTYQQSNESIEAKPLLQGLISQQRDLMMLDEVIQSASGGFNGDKQKTFEATLELFPHCVEHLQQAVPETVKTFAAMRAAMMGLKAGDNFDSDASFPGGCPLKLQTIKAANGEVFTESLDSFFTEVALGNRKLDMKAEAKDALKNSQSCAEFLNAADWLLLSQHVIAKNNRILEAKLLHDDLKKTFGVGKGWDMPPVTDTIRLDSWYCHALDTSNLMIQVRNCAQALLYLDGQIPGSKSASFNGSPIGELKKLGVKLDWDRHTKTITDIKFPMFEEPNPQLQANNETIDALKQWAKKNGEVTEKARESLGKGLTSSLRYGDFPWETTTGTDGRQTKPAVILDQKGAVVRVEDCHGQTVMLLHDGELIHRDTSGKFKASDGSNVTEPPKNQEKENKIPFDYTSESFEAKKEAKGIAVKRTIQFCQDGWGNYQYIGSEWDSLCSKAGWDKHVVTKVIGHDKLTLDPSKVVKVMHNVTGGEELLKSDDLDKSWWKFRQKWAYHYSGKAATAFIDFSMAEGGGSAMLKGTTWGAKAVGAGRFSIAMLGYGDGALRTGVLGSAGPVLRDLRHYGMMVDMYGGPILGKLLPLGATPAAAEGMLKSALHHSSTVGYVPVVAAGIGHQIDRIRGNRLEDRAASLESVPRPVQESAGRASQSASGGDLTGSELATTHDLKSNGRQIAARCMETVKDPEQSRQQKASAVLELGALMADLRRQEMKVLADQNRTPVQKAEFLANIYRASSTDADQLLSTTIMADGQCGRQHIPSDVRALSALMLVANRQVDKTRKEKLLDYASQMSSELGEAPGMVASRVVDILKARLQYNTASGDKSADAEASLEKVEAALILKALGRVETGSNETYQLSGKDLNECLLDAITKSEVAGKSTQLFVDRNHPELAIEVLRNLTVGELTEQQRQLVTNLLDAPVKKEANNVSPQAIEQVKIMVCKMVPDLLSRGHGGLKLESVRAATHSKLTNLFADPSVSSMPDLRLAAIRAIKECGSRDGDTIRLLESRLAIKDGVFVEPSPMVRSLAHKTLRDINPSSVNPLLARHAQEERDPAAAGIAEQAEAQRELRTLPTDQQKLHRETAKLTRAGLNPHDRDPAIGKKVLESGEFSIVTSQGYVDNLEARLQPTFPDARVSVRDGVVKATNPAWFPWTKSYYARLLDQHMNESADDLNRAVNSLCKLAGSSNTDDQNRAISAITVLLSKNCKDTIPLDDKTQEWMQNRFAQTLAELCHTEVGAKGKNGDSATHALANPNRDLVVASCRDLLKNVEVSPAVQRTLLQGLGNMHREGALSDAEFADIVRTSLEEHYQSGKHRSLEASERREHEELLSDALAALLHLGARDEKTMVVLGAYAKDHYYNIDEDNHVNIKRQAQKTIDKLRFCVLGNRDRIHNRPDIVTDAETRAAMLIKDFVEMQRATQSLAVASAELHGSKGHKEKLASCQNDLDASTDKFIDTIFSAGSGLPIRDARDPRLAALVKVGSLATDQRIRAAVGHSLLDVIVNDGGSTAFTAFHLVADTEQRGHHELGLEFRKTLNSLANGEPAWDQFWRFMSNHTRERREGALATFLEMEEHVRNQATPPPDQANLNRKIDNLRLLVNRDLQQAGGASGVDGQQYASAVADAWCANGFNQPNRKLLGYTHSILTHGKCEQARLAATYAILRFNGSGELKNEAKNVVEQLAASAKNEQVRNDAGRLQKPGEVETLAANIDIAFKDAARWQMADLPRNPEESVARTQNDHGKTIWPPIRHVEDKRLPLLLSKLDDSDETVRNAAARALFSKDFRADTGIERIPAVAVLLAARDGGCEEYQDMARSILGSLDPVLKEELFAQEFSKELKRGSDVGGRVQHLRDLQSNPDWTIRLIANRTLAEAFRHNPVDGMKAMENLWDIKDSTGSETLRGYAAKCAHGITAEAFACGLKEIDTGGGNAIRLHRSENGYSFVHLKDGLISQIRLPNGERVAAEQAPHSIPTEKLNAVAKAWEEQMLSSPNATNKQKLQCASKIDELFFSANTSDQLRISPSVYQNALSVMSQLTVSGEEPTCSKARAMLMKAPKLWATITLTHDFNQIAKDLQHRPLASKSKANRYEQLLQQLTGRKPKVDLAATILKSHIFGTASPEDNLDGDIPWLAGSRKPSEFLVALGDRLLMAEGNASKLSTETRLKSAERFYGKALEDEAELIKTDPAEAVHAHLQLARICEYRHELEQLDFFSQATKSPLSDAFPTHTEKFGPAVQHVIRALEIARDKLPQDSPLRKDAVNMLGSTNVLLGSASSNGGLQRHLNQKSLKLYTEIDPGSADVCGPVLAAFSSNPTEGKRLVEKLTKAALKNTTFRERLDMTNRMDLLEQGLKYLSIGIAVQ